MRFNYISALLSIAFILGVVSQGTDENHAAPDDIKNDPVLNAINRKLAQDRKNPNGLIKSSKGAAKQPITGDIQEMHSYCSHTIQNRIQPTFRKRLPKLNEDRLVSFEDKTSNGKLIKISGVFDGHGGQDVSEYLRANLAKDLAKSLEKFIDRPKDK